VKSTIATDEVLSFQEREFEYYRKPCNDTSDQEVVKEKNGSVSEDVYEAQKREMQYYQQLKQKISIKSSSPLSPPSPAMGSRNAALMHQFICSSSTDPIRHQLKEQRKLNTAIGLVGCGVVGGLVFGPAGVIIGGTAGGFVTNKVSKIGERQGERKWDKMIVQNEANISNEFNTGILT